MKRSIVTIFNILIALAAHANEPVNAHWMTLEVSAAGPKTAGEIKVRATTDETDQAIIDISSNYGSYSLKTGVYDPLLTSLTIQWAGANSEFFNDMFTVCFWFGEAIFYNWGTTEKPHSEWRRNKITYTVTNQEIRKYIDLNTDRGGVSDCNP